MSIDGKWLVETSGPAGSAPFMLEIVSSGSEVTGKMSGANRTTVIENGLIDGDTITWEANIKEPVQLKVEFCVTLDGDAFDGTVKYGDFGQGEVTGTRGGKLSDAKLEQKPQRIYETRQPFDLSDELKAKVAELDLAETVQHVKDKGYGYVYDPAPIEFNERLRETIIGLAKDGHSNMLLDKDPIFEEVVLNPKILTMVEILCGKGAMLSQLAGSIKRKGGNTGRLHADQNWTPAPFPVHNQLVTFCWACDNYTKQGGSTKVVPESHLHRRHPNADETAEEPGVVFTECPAGTLVFWDGSTWHGGGLRTIDGERVVLHITFSRLALRPVECYDFLDEDWLEGKPYEMRVMLGREDFLNTPQGAFAHGAKLSQTMDWAKT